MAIYEYSHNETACELGVEFELEQSIHDAALTACPRCGRPVHRLISRTFISSPKSDSDLRNMGFTKLVKRDDGVYENVTRTGKESRYMERDKPDTLPDLGKRISD